MNLCLVRNSVRKDIWELWLPWEAGKAIGESPKIITGVLVRKFKKMLLKTGPRILFL